MDNKAVFLDKDGTLLKDFGYSVDRGKIEFTKEALNALRLLAADGFKLFVISNQPGVALGYQSYAETLSDSKKLESALRENGIELSGFYFCPHSKQDRCKCRKPLPEMILQAAREHLINLSKSWMIGDIIDDTEAGYQAGCRTILINNGNETLWDLNPISRQPDFFASDLSVAAALILKQRDCSNRARRRSRNLSNWLSAKKVLAIRLDAMGDVIMTTPALQALKDSRSSREIFLLTSPAAADTAALLPSVDQVMVYSAPWMKAGSPELNTDRKLIEDLSNHSFDAAVIFTVYSQSPLPAALMAHLCGIPLIAAHCRENPYNLLSDWIHESEPETGIRHEVRRQLDLVSYLGADAAQDNPIIRVPPHAKKQIAEKLRYLGINKCKPLIIIHPGASASSRRYPPERFADVAAILHRNNIGHIILTGSLAEKPLLDLIIEKSQVPCLAFAGNLETAELIALIRKASVIVCNNSGPAHLAAALGTAIVSIYAMTNPQHTPWTDKVRVLSRKVPCRFCYKSECPIGDNICISKIPPAKVADSVMSFLENLDGPKLTEQNISIETNLTGQ